MMREAGFDAEPDDDTRALFLEMKFLKEQSARRASLLCYPSSVSAERTVAALYDREMILGKNGGPTWILC